MGTVPGSNSSPERPGSRRRTSTRGELAICHRRALFLYLSRDPDNRSENFPDTGGESHRQRSPKCHSAGGPQDVCTVAPIAPRRARKLKDAADTMGTRAPAGDTTTMSKGMAAPTDNVAAEVNAACTGRALVISDIPSSSRAWALTAYFAISCWATCRARASRHRA